MEPAVRRNRQIFARHHHNDTFPGDDATQWQWSLGQIVTAVVSAGLEIRQLAEYPEPFWRPWDTDAAA